MDLKIHASHEKFETTIENITCRYTANRVDASQNSATLKIGQNWFGSSTKHINRLRFGSPTLGLILREVRLILESS